MADNTTLPVPSTSGDVIAADDIGGVKYQRVKMTIGSDGVNDGDVSSSNPLPVEIQGSLGTADTRSLGSNLVSGDIGIVSNTVIHGLSTGGGGNYVDVKVNPSGALSVDVGESALPTGAATEATLSAINAVFKAEDTAHVSGDKGLPALAMRSSSDAVTADEDGDYTLLKVDEEGRLKVSSKPASYPDITGDITAVQATIGTPVVGGTVSGDVSRASNIMAFCTGTFSTVNCTFEGSLEASGDTNWFAIQAVRSNANTIETTTGNLSAQPAYAWEMSVNALKRVRVRCTARTSGTQSWRFVQGTYATEPIPAAQVSGTQPVSGTVNIGTSGLTVYTDSSTNLGVSATFTGTSRDAGSTPAYNYFIVNAFADQAGTVRIEKSTDNTTWRRASKDIAVSANAPEEITVKVTARYHRAVYVNGGVAQTQFLLTSSYQRI